MEQKKYVVAGREFELKPQSLRQRQFAAPVWNKILGIIRELASLEATKDASVIDVLEISLRMDGVVLGDDNSFARFLATILSPSGEKWSPSCIEKYADLMLDMDEVTQSEVLQDFLSRQAQPKKDLPGLMLISMSTTAKSQSNGE